MAAAHATAATTEENSSSTPSPMVFTIRPPCPVIIGEMALGGPAAHEPFRLPISRLKPTTSAARIAASLRSTWGSSGPPSPRHAHNAVPGADNCALNGSRRFDTRQDRRGAQSNLQATCRSDLLRSSANGRSANPQAIATSGSGAMEPRSNP
jgi:hypothetical protein